MDLAPLNQGEAAEVVEVTLTDDERRLLTHGLLEWGGPARSTDALAQAMGFRDKEDLWAGGRQIREHLKQGNPLSRFDWFRALVATEFVFASDTYGAATDWEAVSGLSDADSLILLRTVQTKLVGVLGPVRTAIREADVDR